MTADDVIHHLQLQPHPVEGGFFRETWRSTANTSLPTHTGKRSIGTSIYYLLKPGHVSELHVLPGDEVFHFYIGSPVTIGATGVPGTATTIAENAGGGQFVEAGSAVAVPPSVKVTDAYGNGVSGVAVTFPAAPVHNSGPLRSSSAAGVLAGSSLDKS